MEMYERTAFGTSDERIEFRGDTAVLYTANSGTPRVEMDVMDALDLIHNALSERKSYLPWWRIEPGDTVLNVRAEKVNPALRTEGAVFDRALDIKLTQLRQIIAMQRITGKWEQPIHTPRGPNL